MITAELVAVSLCGLVMIGQFVCIGVALYLSYTKGDFMSLHFKTIPSILKFGIHHRSSLRGRVHLIASISGVLTFPGFYIKRGLATAEEINSFPTPLKRKLVMMQWCFIVLMAAMVLLFIIIKSEILN